MEVEGHLQLEEGGWHLLRKLKVEVRSPGAWLRAFNLRLQSLFIIKVERSRRQLDIWVWSSAERSGLEIQVWELGLDEITSYSQREKPDWWDQIRGRSDPGNQQRRLRNGRTDPRCQMDQGKRTGGFGRVMGAAKSSFSRVGLGARGKGKVETVWIPLGEFAS